MIKRLVFALVSLAIVIISGTAGYTLIETGDAVILIGESTSIREVKAVKS